MVSEKDNRELTWRGRAIHDLEAPDAHISLAHYFLRFEELETEILIALERANASFEKGNFRVETVGRGWCPPLIDATQ